jgi:hypothetical protein
MPWTTTRTPTERISDGVVGFQADAVHEAGDCLAAHVKIGDVGDNCGRAYWGLPDELALHRIWNVSHIRRGDARARMSGGIRALLDYLCVLADASSVWLTTEVDTGDSSRNANLIRILEQLGFEASDPEFPRVLLREPRE